MALGEALVDFLPVGGHEEWAFIARPGGAPANVAVGLARLGTTVAFIGRVGRDALGARVARALADAGVDMRALQYDDTKHTPIAIVVPSESDPDRFLIYRSDAADGALQLDAHALNVVAEARVVHIGTLSLASERSRASTYAAIDAARSRGVTVSVDANLRPSAWESRDRLLLEARLLVGSADIVKLTAHELEALGLEIRTLLRTATVVLVTEGAAGAYAFTHGRMVHVAAPAAPVADPTGAGDAFAAAYLHVMLEARRPLGGDQGDLLQAAVYAGSLAVQRAGGMDSLPTREELRATMAAHGAQLV